nr:MAG TPA: hypothetical protein [Caudoviricetes sp.]
MSDIELARDLFETTPGPCSLGNCFECRYFNKDNICIELKQAESLVARGYQKIKWHKITDEKIPLEDGKDVLVIDDYGNYWVAKYVKAINWFAIYEMDWPYKFIAWTELPKFNK